MFLMMGEVLRFHAVAAALPGSAFWAFLAKQQSHAPWVGCNLHDLIQPSFSFIVGVALPFSIAARLARGHAQSRLTLHAFWRALLLILLGVFLRSTGATTTQTNWTFEDTLSQIGMGYGFLFLLGFRSVRVQWAALCCILLAYWAFFAAYPLPGPEFDWARIGIKPDWPGNLPGFAAHWNINTNPAWAFDTWFMNLFPRKAPFNANGGGYSTLSFIPTLATMILGLIAGETLRSDRAAKDKIRWLFVAGRREPVPGLVAGAPGRMPGRKTDLDAQLGVVQRWLVLPAVGGVLRHNRCLGTQGVVVPARGHRYEFYRGLLHRGVVARLHLQESDDQPWAGILHGVGRGVRAVPERFGDAAGVLADPLLDVQAEAVPPHLMYRNMLRPDAGENVRPRGRRGWR